MFVEEKLSHPAVQLLFVEEKLSHLQKEKEMLHTVSINAGHDV